MRILIFLTFIIPGTILFAQDFDLGFVAGLNMSRYAKAETAADLEDSYSSKYSGLGYGGGMMVIYFFNQCYGLKSKLMYSRRIMQFDIGEDVTEVQNFDYIDLSISPLLRLSNRFNISLGLQLSYLLNNLAPPKDWASEKTKFSLGILSNVTYQVTNNVGICIEYQLGTSLLENDLPYAYEKFDNISLLLSYSIDK